MAIYTPSYNWSHHYAGRVPSTLTEIGDRSYVYDSDFTNTYWGSNVFSGGDGDFSNANAIFLTYEFPEEMTVSRIRWRAWIHSLFTGNNYENNFIGLVLKLTNTAGNITTLYRYTTPDYGTAIDTQTTYVNWGIRSNRTTRDFDAGVVEYTGTWTNIKRVHLNLFGSNGGDDWGGSELRIYGLDVDAHMDSSLRYSKGGVTYGIGCTPLQTNDKVRVNKNGTIYTV